MKILMECHPSLITDGNNECSSEDVIWELLNGDVYDDNEGPSIFVTPNPRKKRRTEDGPAKTFLNFSRYLKKERMGNCYKKGKSRKGFPCWFFFSLYTWDCA